MSKIAQYLNEHLVGEVSGLASLRNEYSTDRSVLQITPELVVYPRVTNDIRKVARFTWQLAEKGHAIGLTTRGFGNDQTGGAIGSGIIIDTSKYLRDILYIATKDKHKIAHVQPGVAIETLQQALKWNGLTINAVQALDSDMTVGGAISGGITGPAASKHGTIADAVERMEVVLANGDLIETSRISRREVDRKKGEQTLEGEIYRQLDGLIEDNQELIASLTSDRDYVGYRIDQVKHKDGSFDLTPLFIGSQGTLGIISEVVLKADFYNADEAVLAVVCETIEEARDIADILATTDPTVLQVIDGAYYQAAHARGKRYVFDTEGDIVISAIVYASYDDFSDRVRAKQLKKAAKLLSKRSLKVYSSEDSSYDDLYAIRDVESIAAAPLRVDENSTYIGNGAYIPKGRYEEFAGLIAELAEKYHVSLPIKHDVLSGIVTVRPFFHLKKVSDRQKVFKLASDYAEIVYKLGGTLSGRFAEGRFNAYAQYPHVDTAVIELYQSLRRIFDPFGTLNPGVKQAADIKVLARQIKDE